MLLVARQTIIHLNIGTTLEKLALETVDLVMHQEVLVLL